MSLSTLLKTSAETTRDDLATKADEAVAKGARLVEKAQDKAEEAGDAALKEISALVASLNEKINALGVSSETLSDKAKSTYADIEKVVVNEVNERPVRTLALVGLAGIALGLLSRK